MSILFEFEKKVDRLRKKIEELKSMGRFEQPVIEEIEKKFQKKIQEFYESLTPWDKVQIARHPDRPHAIDYINNVFTDFIELHGDRHYGDGKAIVAGFAKFEGIPVCIIGQEKGRDTKEKIARNFGMPVPEDYRKALRVMKLAEKLGKPIVTLVDTPGAFPGIEAEEHGQSEAIAKNLFEMVKLRVPVISVVIGEGGSGGALAISVANKLLMLENAIYSVISPEGCAAILWQSQDKVKEAAEALKLTSKDLLKLGAIDGIIPEPIEGAHRDYETTFKNFKEHVLKALNELLKMTPQELVKQRYEKFRKIAG
ncbi:Acetyl-coenzyme A carboxylase carboxyl transferase subunit alpha [Desulfurobacterium thermolithotrophum DSM 11699]|uniref:Acetyl-coenzyme A carboxylase carboxyl transferase subunit alpha n=1 Tax=Desulfurobacterium thermolithotrophum (strain DSM 11699 / BSA) TaxID=868864 RepID=F0S0A5_DESTD|nr:acetyl-CoA carboxylase carboxyltransferase subunit alpha [Desulfurobacterium thermolithotrophum]ADY73784.1 Acetyl-coenzyme A carboxylase carboxyl transferase subunit alpha [Desulfurobacterium thermolithotrophum DSM 11699]